MEKLEKLKQDYNSIIVHNINELLNRDKVSKSDLLKEISGDGKKLCAPQYLGSLLNHPEKTHLTAAMLKVISDFLGVSMDDLSSVQFNPDEYIKKDSELHETYKILADRCKEIKIKPIFHFDFDSSEVMKTNPRSSIFEGYCQEYYCYYFPTSSDETRKGKFLYGHLVLEDVGEYCKATLKVDTDGKYRKEKKDYQYTKEYVGYAVISTSMSNVYAIMLSEKGEFCFVSFRHFSLNNKKLFCRIAEVLSSSAGTEARRPTVQRMFLSSEAIQKEDIEYIKSSLHLNCSEIYVEEQKLTELRNKSEEYKKVVERLQDFCQVKKICVFDERTDALKATENILEEKERLEFLAELRNIAISSNYNKISEAADKNIIKLLQEKGYYREGV